MKNDELVTALREKRSRDSRKLLDAAADAIENLTTNVLALQAEVRKLATDERLAREEVAKLRRERDAQVHCRDCKYGKPDILRDDCTVCDHCGWVMRNDFFCAYGEKGAGQ